MKNSDRLFFFFCLDLKLVLQGGGWTWYSKDQESNQIKFIKNKNKTFFLFFFFYISINFVWESFFLCRKSKEKLGQACKIFILQSFLWTKGIIKKKIRVVRFKLIIIFFIIFCSDRGELPVLGYAGSVQEKERRLNELILQLQMVREHLLNQQGVSLFFYFF